MASINDIIINAINICIDRKILTMPFDCSDSYMVVGVNGDGTYKVSVKGAKGLTYTVKNGTNMTFITGNQVWVTTPRNNINNMFISGKNF